MVAFLFRRCWNGLLVMAGVIAIVFILFNILPADPARMMLGQRSDSASVVAINRDLGLDRSAGIRLLLYLNDLSPLSIHSTRSSSAFFLDPGKYRHTVSLVNLMQDKVLVLKAPYLRRSYQSKKEVSELLFEKFPETGMLALSAMLISVGIGIVLGIISALHKDSLADRFCLAISVSGVALPSFFASIIFAWLFGYVFSSVTGLNMTGSLIETDPFRGDYIAWKNLILPAIVLGLRPLAIITQLMRNSMLEVLSQDFIRTARAKGIPGKIIVMKHAFRNSLNPVITAISGWLGSLLAGAVFVEFIFGWNGIGKLTVTALDNYDLPVVMGIVLCISLVFILLNILSDLINGLIDPRIRLE
ncbi:MAG: ABC transporter permease [Bacteroidia bacterium]|nr:ABC transporter permease [Bacteroidia bacterium]